MLKTLSSVLRSVSAGASWLLLLLVGLFLQAFQASQALSPNASLALFLVGGLLVVIGGAGIGQRIGRDRADETLRLKLAPAFRRTFRMYRRLLALQVTVGERRALAAQARSNGAVPFDVVDAGLGVIEARLDEQLQTVDDAMDEWTELTPAEVAAVKATIERDVNDD